MFTALTSSSGKSLDSWACVGQEHGLMAGAVVAVGGLMVEGVENPA